MDRLFKFRAWTGSEILYNISPWKWDFVIETSWHRCEKNTGQGFLDSGCQYGEFLVPGRRFEKIMQFTGLTDKNGKEIYEGDLVRDQHTLFEIHWTKGRFDFKRLSGSYQSPYFGDNCSRMEVIGNIYETPELLNDGTSGR